MTKRFIIALLIFLSATFCAGKVAAQQQSSSTIMEAKVLSIEQTEQVSDQSARTIQNVKLQIVSGPLKGKTIMVKDGEVQAPYVISYQEGDHVIVTESKGPNNSEIFYITDYVRKWPLLLLLIIFLALTVVVARWQGASSILGMAVSLFIMIAFIVPNILKGADPLQVTLLASAFIVPLTFYLAHGFNKKTTIAVIATFVTLVLTATLAYIFTDFAKLTGFANEDALYLQNLKGSAVNIKGILLAGIIIAALAVLNDITVSQASVIESLKKSNPSLSWQKLFTHGMEVGKDHIASLVNTLILVYAGVSLPLLILFFNANTSVSLILNQEIIATEIVRTLVISIGIILAVPLTTLIAAFAAGKD